MDDRYDDRGRGWRDWPDRDDEESDENSFYSSRAWDRGENRWRDQRGQVDRDRENRGYSSYGHESGKYRQDAFRERGARIYGGESRERPYGSQDYRDWNDYENDTEESFNFRRNLRDQDSRGYRREQNTDYSRQYGAEREYGAQRQYGSQPDRWRFNWQDRDRERRRGASNRYQQRYGDDQPRREYGEGRREYGEGGRDSGERYSRPGYNRPGYNRGEYRGYGAGRQSDGGEDAGDGSGYRHDDSERYAPRDRNRQGDQGDVGYNSEGAFYQDLDNPYSYETWEARGGFPQRGRFTGMGPSGYQRSRERIFEEVCERLTEHGQIDASDIEVTVEDDQVILRGTVPDRFTQRLAEDVADEVHGVQDVLNELKVRSRREERQWSSLDAAMRPDHSRTEDQRPRSDEKYEYSIANTGMSAEEMTTESVMDRTEGSQRQGVRADMEVIGRDGQVIGRVKEIRENDFLVDRELARDVYVPFDAIQSTGEHIMLNVDSLDVDTQDWERPAIL